MAELKSTPVLQLQSLLKRELPLPPRPRRLGPATDVSTSFTDCSSTGTPRSSSVCSAMSSPPRLGAVSTTWKRRNLESELQHVRTELEQERLHSDQLEGQLRTAYSDMEKLKNQLDLQRERDELLNDLTRPSTQASSVQVFDFEPPRLGGMCRSDGTALAYAADFLRRDKEVVLAAVHCNGLALASASRDLRRDREVVLVAVRSHGLALHHASEELKADKEVVRAAVRSHGLALQHASEELRADRTTVIMAARSHAVALLFASQELCEDLELLQAAGKAGGNCLGLDLTSSQSEAMRRASSSGGGYPPSGGGGYPPKMSAAEPGLGMPLPPLPKVGYDHDRMVRFTSADFARRQRPASVPARPGGG